MNEKIERILVATDGTPESVDAFAAMMPVVRAYDPEVSVVYVFEDPTRAFLPPDEVAKACSALRSNRVDAHLEVLEGPPGVEIPRHARRRNMDLIVIASHGRRGLKRLFAGSVAEEVVRRSEVPVLVTRPGTAIHDWKRMVVALDGSERAEAILKDVVPLARRLKALVEVLQVATPIVAPLGMGEAPNAVMFDDPMPYLKRVQRTLAAQGVEAQAVAPQGRAATRIMDHARETGTSLICMTTHGRTGLGRVILGSIAEEIMRQAPCPVLLRRTIESEPPPGEVMTPEAGIHLFA